ncbi:4-hydroxy-tetrahydrodipicolinate reductase [Alphaproteobacteria bacterium]|nr:4-hydroxy-tetrahydrodipicolinate reductase [Alphaproteobacteria bacterium]
MSATDKITFSIPGGSGRMGNMLIREIAHASDLVLHAASDRPESPSIGKDSGELAGIGANGVMIASDPAALVGGDVIVDFTSPAASMAHAELAAQNNMAMVIGTTGLSASDEARLAEIGTKIPLVYCANTSVGVTLLRALVEQVAAQLVNGWDIEILETHHHHKVDSPSGTALALGKAAAKGRGVALEDVSDIVRDDKMGASRAGARKAGDIGFAVMRGGDVTGEHSVTFFGASERIALTHMATDRVVFAKGAIRAARFAASADIGFYNMEDVLRG